MTKPGDVVLVYMDNSPSFFARVELITPDIKPEWYQIKLLVLQIPLLAVTWILKEDYYNGEEFTMGGHPMRIEQVDTPSDEQLVEGADKKPLEKKELPKPALVENKKEGKVISIFDRRKKDHEPS
ncbi:MAG: hypothetical protein ABFD97_16960 [Syntrophobacter sp.]